MQAQQGAANRGFTAAAFANQPKRLSLLDRETDVIDCFDIPYPALKQNTTRDGEVFLQISYFDEGCGFFYH